MAEPISETIFVVRNGERMGPYSEGAAWYMIDKGLLDPDDLAHRQGETRLVTLADLLPTIWMTHPTPEARGPLQRFLAKYADTTQEVTKPWRRCLARHVDICFFVIGLLAILRLTGHSGFVEETQKIVLVWIALACGTAAEAVVMVLLGTTPGKFLAGIQVSNIDRSRRGLWPAFRRAWAVLIQGLGLGLPVIYLICGVFVWIRQRNGGRAPWDVAGHHGVFNLRRPWWTW